MGLGLAAIQNTLELWQQGYFEEINSVAEMGSQELHVTGEDFRNLIQQACLPDNEKYDFPASCLGNVYNIGFSTHDRNSISLTHEWLPDRK